uniref:Formylglycine-generating enzyme, required for sulfatase activity, contains SUMF1/FGE domain n=1 Tax=Candidatus Kentrum sp. DK TaxID=2126562 RepID=A0A450SEJ9_9GAMM|nr:MAG: Formylglycine-generating enzyme, required for sulfatase activity, contains SUMF1/FGE domain [Candidatus Kentron sp. DK]
MEKFALLIGVSEYPDSVLTSLPVAINNIDDLRTILIDPELGGFSSENVILLPNPGRVEMESAIDNLFRERQKDDLVLLFFSGHIIRDGGKLYFATKETEKNSSGKLVRAGAVPADDVHGYMKRSRSSRQVVILDSHFDNNFPKRLFIKLIFSKLLSGGQIQPFGKVASDENSNNNVHAPLGGKGWVILFSSSSIRHLSEERDRRLSPYTHFLVHGIKTSEAEKDGDGFISAGELHNYAYQNIREEQPAMWPKIYSGGKGKTIHISAVSIEDPKKRYSDEVRKAVDHRGEIPNKKRSTLDRWQDQLRSKTEEKYFFINIEEDIKKFCKERFQGNCEKYGNNFKKTLEKGKNTIIATRSLENSRKELGLEKRDAREIRSEVKKEIRKKRNEEKSGEKQVKKKAQKQQEKYEAFLKVVIRQEGAVFSSETQEELSGVSQALGLTDEEKRKIQDKVGQKNPIKRYILSVFASIKAFGWFIGVLASLITIIIYLDPSWSSFTVGNKQDKGITEESVSTTPTISKPLPPDPTDKKQDHEAIEERTESVKEKQDSSLNTSTSISGFALSTETGDLQTTTIAIDRKIVEQTDSGSHSALAANGHKVPVEKESGKPAENRVEPTRIKRETKQTLVPKSAELSVQVKPTDTTITINKKDYSPSDSPYNLPAGKYTLRAFRQGYKDSEEKFELTAGGEETITVSLVPKPAQLIVRSNAPPGTDTVFIDNRPVGPTSPGSHELSAGEYKVRVERKDFEPFETKVKLVPGEIKTIAKEEVVLIRKPRLRVRSDVGRDKLYIDNRDVGSTGSRFHVLESGKPTMIRVEKKDRDPFEIKVTLAAEEKRAIFVHTKDLTFRDGLKNGSWGANPKKGSWGPKMKIIPKGEFKMGSPNEEEGHQSDEGPQHRVVIPKPFSLGVTEVTRADYGRCVRATKCTKPSGNHSGGFPVTNLSWEDAKKYADWLIEQTGNIYRLPSEAEWEYAARAGTKTRYFWGDDDDKKTACTYANVYDISGWEKHYYEDKDGGYRTSFDCDDGKPGLTTVGRYQPNDFGLFDMSGNVWEWIADCRHQSYIDAPDDGSVWEKEDCKYMMHRGGSWGSKPENIRSATRGGGVGPTKISPTYGFRLARDL